METEGGMDYKGHKKTSGGTGNVCLDGGNEI